MRRYLPLLLLCACGEPRAPLEAIDPRRECALAEQNLLALDCRDARGRALGGPNLRGEPFRRVCETAWRNAVDVNPRCLKAARSCPAAERCPR